MKIDYEQIEKYFNNLLEEDEKIEFELRLKDNPEFKEEVFFYKNSILELEHIHSNKDKLNELESTLNKIGKDYFTKETKVISFRKYIAPIIGLAAVLILGIFILYPKGSLYEQYAEHKPLTVAVKSGDGSKLFEASKYFNIGQYKKAEEFLFDYLKNHPSDHEARFTLGICYLELGQSDNARRIFRSDNIVNSVFKNKGEWYFALSAVKSGQLEMAKEVLAKIPSSSEYYDSAKELLGKL